jgi:hypothetical protein
MRSPDSRRAAVETLLRAASVAAMAALAVRFWFGTPKVQPEATAATPVLDSALVAWSQEAPRRATVHASLTPDAIQRDWLLALRRTGSHL